MPSLKRWIGPARPAFTCKGLLALAGLAAACAVPCARGATPEGLAGAAPANDGWLISPETCLKLEYPPLAARNNQQGTVELRYMVDAAGAVPEVKVVRSSGSAALDVATIDVIKSCTFRPAQPGTAPAPAWQRMQYVWQLEGMPPSGPDPWGGRGVDGNDGAKTDEAVPGAAPPFR